MATIDIFSDNAFSLVELTLALNDVEYLPQTLGQMGVFTGESVRTEKVAVERRGDTLALVPTTERGAAPVVKKRDTRNIRDVTAPRLAKQDTLRASEIAGIRAFGTESEFEQVQTEVMRRMQRLRNDMELTHENMRLGAVQGIVLDADGSELFNWFTEFGIAQPAEQVYNFADLVNGKFRERCNQLIRQAARASQGAWVPGTGLYALCGDEFYDALIKNAEVRETYTGWAAAADLREAAASPFSWFPFGGIMWGNYRGTDDNSKVAVPSTRVKFFPVGAPDVFKRYNTPGEFFDTINMPGQEFYALTIPDEKRNAYVDIELYSYPLYMCTRPGMLLRGRL